MKLGWLGAVMLVLASCAGDPGPANRSSTSVGNVATQPSIVMSQPGTTRLERAEIVVSSDAIAGVVFETPTVEALRTLEPLLGPGQIAIDRSCDIGPARFVMVQWPSFSAHFVSGRLARWEARAVGPEPSRFVTTKGRRAGDTVDQFRETYPDLEEGPRPNMFTVNDGTGVLYLGTNESDRRFSIIQARDLSVDCFFE